MSTINVLHVLGRMDHGGAELRLVELIGRLPRHEFRVDVCALSGLPGSLDGRVAEHGGAVIPLPIDWRFAWRFVRLLRAGHYHVVHSHVLHASGVILALAALAGIRIRVAHFHSTRDGHAATLRRTLQRWITRGLLQHYATDIIACGEGSMDAVWQPNWRHDARCRVIYDAIDPARFEPRGDRRIVRTAIGVPADAPVFIHVGYEAAAKNHPRLLRIFAAIAAREPAARLVLVGEGTDRPDGLTAAGTRELGLEGRVVPLGVRDDVPRLLAAADVLLLPSLHEGLPGVVLEACLAGVPVLATDLPGVREIAVRLAGVHALPLSAPDEEWASLALALLIEAARLREQGQAGERFRASVFHVDRAVDAHRALWTGAMEQRS